MKSYKDVVKRAQEICAEAVADHTTTTGALYLKQLIELFDGPELREVEARDMVKNCDYDTAEALAEARLVIGWEGYTEVLYKINVAKGFMEAGRVVNVGDQLLLMVSEICEAYEAHRKGLKDDKVPTREGLEVELADTVIRIMNYGRHFKLDIPGAIIEKTAFNKNRPYMHGDKKC